MNLKKLLSIIMIVKMKIKKFHSMRPSAAKRKLKIQILKMFILCKELLRKQKLRSQWVRYIFTEERRFLQGASHNLLVELENYDTDKYVNYLRMSPELFYDLLNNVGPSIAKKNFIRASISAKTRLHIFLRYLASGNSMISLSYEFRVGVSTVSDIVKKTADAIYDVLSPKVLMQEPNKQDWKRISKDFEEKWNMAHCVGAIDGRHMVIQVMS